MGILTTMKKFNDPTNGFIKAYKSLRNLPLNLNQICFLEYVLSFTSGGLEFRDHDANIGQYLKMTAKSTNNLINNLSNLGYITTSRRSHAGQSGWTRYIELNQNLIQSQLDNTSTIIETEILIENVENAQVAATIEITADIADSQVETATETEIIPIQFNKTFSKPTENDFLLSLDDENDSDYFDQQKQDALEKMLGAKPIEKLEKVSISTLSELKQIVGAADTEGVGSAVGNFFMNCENWKLDYSIGFANNLIFREDLVELLEAV